MCLPVCFSNFLFGPRKWNGHKETMTVGKGPSMGLGTGKRGHLGDKRRAPSPRGPRQPRLRSQPFPQLTSHPICLPLPGLAYPKECASHLKNISKNRPPNVLKKRLNISPLGAGLSDRDEAKNKCP